MNVAVLGTGDVGRQLGTRFASKGHAVKLGSRSAENTTARAWVEATDGDVGCGTFAEVTAWAELVVLAVSGQNALAVVEAAGSGLDGKVLLDLTNPLDFSQGFPPRLFVCNDDSLAERIQRAAPAARVVKTLNMIANQLMLDPGELEGPHDILLAGNDDGAKATVVELLKSFGWTAPIDLGDLTNARAMEMWLPLWTRLYGKFGTPMFNLRLQGLAQ